MKELVVLSGKGGTGKTTFMAALSRLVPGAVLADCDVDVPNLHLLVHGETIEEHDFTASRQACSTPPSAPLRHLRRGLPLRPTRWMT